VKLLRVAEPADRGRLPLFFLAGGDCYLYLLLVLRVPQTVDFSVFFLCFFLDMHLSLLLLRVCFTAGQFVMGSVFFSSASGGRSGGAAMANVAVMGRRRRYKTGGRR
jgi:hypothetical protein